MKRNHTARKWVPGMLNDVPESWKQERAHFKRKNNLKDRMRRLFDLMGFLVLILVFWSLAESSLAQIVSPDKKQIGQESSLLWLRNVEHLAPEYDHDSPNELPNVESIFPAPILSTDIQITAVGPIVRARVTQTFSNPSEKWVEGIYSYPLPVGASVDALEMRSGDTLIKGEVKEKNLAKKVYQAAKKAGYKASLLSHHRTNVFTSSVANIAPGETISIEFEYQQVVGFRDNQYRLRFPMVNTPKYSPQGGQNEVSKIDKPINFMKAKSDPAGNPVSISLDLNSGIAIEPPFSPSHPINTTKVSETHYRVDLTGVPEQSNRDFVLNWRPVESDRARATVLHEVHENEVYALMMVVPPTSESTSHLGRAMTSGLKRVLWTESEMSEDWSKELILVLDISGSMQGESIRQAKKAVLEALSKLKPNDRFNLIYFNNQAGQIFPTSRQANNYNLNVARSYILSLEANGGTEMLSALELALQSQDSTELMRQVVFITDGAVGNEHQLFNKIRAKLGNSRLFTVGIGSAPNSYFMKKAALFGRGSFTYISRPEDAGPKISSLLEKLSNPAMADLTLDLEGRAAEVFPRKLPDLYIGEPIYVAFKVDSLPSQALFNGTVKGREYRLEIPFEDKSYKGIAKFWAAKKVDSLESDMREPGAPTILVDSARELAIETALEHQIVSQNTSLVAVDHSPSRLEDELVSKRLKSNRPKGWGQSGSMRLAKTDAGLFLDLLELFLWCCLLLVLVYLLRSIKASK